jgi:general secretion pathway protein K
VTRRTQHGIALLTAIVLVAIAAILATAIAFSSAMAARRASTVFGADQSLLVAEGAEAMAAYVLMQSGPNSTQDALNQPWAQSYGPFQLLPGVTLDFLQLEDQQGKFNINNLAPGGTTSATTVAEFTRLLTKLQLEPKWAWLIADWIDSNDTPNFPDGAEDSVYLGQSPPYRTANLPVTSVSELLALPGFGRDRFDRLSPYISALPPGTPLNVCTASGVLLDAISGQDEYEANPQQLLVRRQQEGCFPTLTVYQASLSGQTGSQQQAAGAMALGQRTSYFRLRTFITIGTARFTLYSLLQRDGAGQIHVILRTFGTE